MTEGAKKLADNVLLLLAARAMMVLCGPLMIWLLVTVSSTQRLQDKHELRIEITEREIRLIKETRAQELQSLHASLAAITAELGQVKLTSAVIAQQQKDTDRRLDELRSYLEGRLGIRPPR